MASGEDSSSRTPDSLPESAGSGRRRRRRRRRGSTAGALIGAALALGVLGLPLGLLVWALGQQAALSAGLPVEGEAAFGVVLIVALPVTLLGLAQGASPGRLRRAALVGVAAFLLGAVTGGTLGGLLGLLLPLVAGEVTAEAFLTRPQVVEVALEAVPLSALLGGLALAPWAGYRAWARGRPWTRAARPERFDGAGQPGIAAPSGAMSEASERPG